MRLRYVTAAVVASIWLIVFQLVVGERGSFLPFVAVFVGTLIFGAIAWPEDFKRDPRARRDGPPRT